MASTRARATLGFGFLAASLLASPADLSAQRYLKQLIGLEPAAPPTADSAVSAEPSAEQVMRDSVVALARAQLGQRYRFGGERPEEGFDCSGLIRYVMSAFQLSLPRTAALQALAGREVNKDPEHLKPGDLLTFGKGSRVTHIGIYVGEGRFIHASSTAGQVVESPVIRPPHPRIRPWRGVRRLLTSGSDSTHASPG